MNGYYKQRTGRHSLIASCFLWHCCGPLACPGITVALVVLIIIPVNPFAPFECWHVCPVWHFIAFQDLGKVLLMLQAISQKLSKNSWMWISHSYLFNVELLYAVAAHLWVTAERAAQSGPAWIHSHNTTQLCWDQFSSPQLVLAHQGSAPYCG